MTELPQPTNKGYPQANQCEYEQLSIWWVRFTPSTNYNQFLLFPGLNWSRYGIAHSERLGYQLWQWPLKMALLVYEREIGIVSIEMITCTVTFDNICNQGHVHRVQKRSKHRTLWNTTGQPVLRWTIIRHSDKLEPIWEIRADPGQCIALDTVATLKSCE